jgi:hypothetical protein
VGAYTRYKITLQDGTEIEATRSAELPGSLREGDEVSVHFPTDRMWFVPHST